MGKLDFKKLKTYTLKNITDIFIASLFIMAPNWKQPSCPSVGEGMDKLVPSDNGILFSTKKRNE